MFLFLPLFIAPSTLQEKKKQALTGLAAIRAGMTDEAGVANVMSKSLSKLPSKFEYLCTLGRFTHGLVTLNATSAIKPGMQILVDYGQDYWGKILKYTRQCDC